MANTHHEAFTPNPKKIASAICNNSLERSVELYNPQDQFSLLVSLNFMHFQRCLSIATSLTVCPRQKGFTLNWSIQSHHQWPVQRPHQLANCQSTCPKSLCIVKPTLTGYTSPSKGAVTPFTKLGIKGAIRPSEHSAHTSPSSKSTRISSSLNLEAPREKLPLPWRTGHLLLPITISIFRRQETWLFTYLRLRNKTRPVHARTHSSLLSGINLKFLTLNFIQLRC